MIYERENGKRSFFKNSYQEIATYSVIGVFLCQLAIDSIEKLLIDKGGVIWYILILLFVLYCIYYISKFKKYYNIVD